jgi:hypothetical protein
VSDICPTRRLAIHGRTINDQRSPLKVRSEERLHCISHAVCNIISCIGSAQSGGKSGISAHALQLSAKAAVL